MAEPLVLSGIGFGWPDTPPLFHDLQLRLEPGSFTAVVGPSGCGKSTLLRLVGGLLQPTAGTISGVPARKAMVFQAPTLLAWRSVRENVALPLELGHGEGDIDAALELVGLADVAESLPRALSGGMRMRVSLARALVTVPDLLLLDEPLSGLDALSRRRLQRELLVLWRKLSFTALMVTHDIDEAVLLADRVIVLGHERPATVRADRTVDLPRPRTTESAHDPRLGALSRELEALL